MYRLLRHAFRQLCLSPGFAATAIVTLTVGIGATVAIFAILDAVLLEPLPFPRPDRLVAVESQPDGVVSIPTMQDYEARSTSFESLTAYRSWSPERQGADALAARRILAVSQGFLATLGVRFALGSNWAVSGNEQDCNLQAIVSGAFWNRIGGSALGERALNLDNRTFRIAGVLPAEQEIEGSGELNRPEVFVPVGCDAEENPNSRGDQAFNVIGRLRPGVTLPQANADLVRVDRTLQQDYPGEYPVYNAAVRQTTLVFPYIELLVGTDARSGLLMTFAACGLLLLIACSNLGNLLLARITRRRGEFATRATLGATPRHLLAQLVFENGLMVVLGAAGGIALALLVLKLVKASAPIHMPRLAHASLHPAVFAFILLLSAGVVFLLTVLPARRALRPGLLADLQGAGHSTSSRSLRVAGRLLVIAQISLALVLLACAGWMIGSVYLLLHQPLGFAPDHLLQAEVWTGSPISTQTARAELELEQMAASLRELPGVISSAVTDHPPLGHAINRYDFCSDAHPEQCARQVTINPDSYAITPGYFATIGQSLLEGRDFTTADDGRNHVAIVNQVLAAREWPGQSALGHLVSTGEIHVSNGRSWATVVGVAGNVHSYDLVSPPGPDIYVPRAEDPGGFGTILLQVNGDPAALRQTVRDRLKAQFPSARVLKAETMREEMSSEVVLRVFLMRVGLAFGAIALFLSILGTYGLLAYEVSLREKEIGIRLALGSTRKRVIRLLIREEGLWLMAGTLLGLACAAGAGYVLRSRFYEAHSTSPLVLAGSALLLLAPALLAIALPARRAALQDPAQTLRRE